MLGVFADWQYEQAAAEMEPGARLLLFTDGASEATGSGDVEFGEERLAALAVSLRDQDARSIKDAILRNIHSFAGGNLQDDATVVVASAKRAGR